MMSPTIASYIRPGPCPQGVMQVSRYAALAVLLLAAPVFHAAGQTTSTLDTGPGVPAGTPRRFAITAAAGAFNSGRDGERSTPALLARLDREVAPWLLAEVGVMATRVQRFQVDAYDPDGLPLNHRNVTVPLAAADLQLQVQWPTGHVRPYVGAGGGLFSALRASFTAPRFVRPSYTGAAGARIGLTRSLGLRGEIRFRGDAYPRSSNTFDFEQTLGLSWRY